MFKHGNEQVLRWEHERVTAFLSNDDRPKDRPTTGRSTNRRTLGVRGKLHFKQYAPVFLTNYHFFSSPYI